MVNDGRSMSRSINGKANLKYIFAAEFPRLGLDNVDKDEGEEEEDGPRGR